MFIPQILAFTGQHEPCLLCSVLIRCSASFPHRFLNYGSSISLPSYAIEFRCHELYWTTFHFLRAATCPTNCPLSLSSDQCPPASGSTASLKCPLSLKMKASHSVYVTHASASEVTMDPTEPLITFIFEDIAECHHAWR